MPSRQASGVVVAQIEAILEPVLSSLARNQPASIKLASKRRDTVSFEEVYFPGRSAAEARKFARVILILQLVHDSVVSGTVLTKRNVFYQNQDLFGDQAQVDSLVDAVALTLAVSREDLNIVAASKGIFVGQSTVHLANGTNLDLSSGDSGTPIPLSGIIGSIDLSTVRWVLVIEKDAVFKTLCSTRYWANSVAGPGLIATAKGYPDLMTREFLQIVNKRAPNLPILALTDYDVDGLNIVRCYRYSMDPTSRSPATVNPGICWLGIKTAQVLKLAASMPALPGNNHSKSSDQLTISDDLALEGAIPPIECRDPIRHLTLRDRKVGMSVLAALLSHEGTDPTSAEMKIELQRMLMLGIKCEIQFLDESGSLVSWLDTSLLDHVSFLDDK